LPPTKADQNTSVAWQLSWFKPNGKLLAENKISYETKENPKSEHPQNQLKKVWCQEVCLDYFRSSVFPCFNTCKWS